MTTIKKQAIVPYTVPQMLALVEAIEEYPQFLPWCRSTRILSRQHQEVLATIELARGVIHKSFTTRNITKNNNRIEISLVEGPFRTLTGYWSFDALGEQGCKVSLNLHFELANALMSASLGPVFSQIANTLVEAFCKRAVHCYGK